MSRRGRAVHVLRGDMAFEDVLEVRRQRSVDVEEVRHVDDVVDDLAAVGVDDGGVPMPVGPLVTGRALDPRDRHLRRRRLALGVVPHEQHPVLLEGRPRRGAGQPRHPLAVGHLLASAVAAPPPVVERAGDLVALDLALGEVAAHVPAVAVEHVDLAVPAAEHHQLLPERVHRVRLTVAEVPGQPKAVPAAGESGRRCFGLDLPNRRRSISDCNVMTSFYSRGTGYGADRPAGRERPAARPIPRLTVGAVTTAQHAPSLPGCRSPIPPSICSWSARARAWPPRWRPPSAD